MTARRRPDKPGRNLARLGESERSVVLSKLLAAHPDLATEADEIAARLLTTVDPGAVAGSVMWELTNLDMDDLRLGPAEQREQLVDGQLLEGEHGSERRRFRWEEPVIDAQVHLGVFITRAHRETSEAVRDLTTLHHDPLGQQRGFERGSEPVDGVGITDEEVEIVRDTVDRAANDERAAARQGEAVRLGQRNEDGRDALLQWAQQGSWTPR